MRVEGGGKKFQPITLIIETEEEAEKLWHYLNMPCGSSLEEYANDRPFIEEIDTFIYELWKVLDLKYTPKGDRP